MSGSARARILDAAYQLFSREGIRAIGVDRVVAEAGVAKMTLYRHFASKEELVLAFLELRGERWSRDWLQAEAERLAPDPSGRALVMFDLLDEWFHSEDFEGCSFVNTLLEIHDKSDPVHQAAARHLEAIRVMLRGYFGDDPNPDESAYLLQTMMLGSIASAGRGDLNAARRARAAVAVILDRAGAAGAAQRR
jgi:AcrR family transcriptional regulator